MAATALLALLEDLASVVATVKPADYIAEPLPGVSGSIGAHVRHTLDHVAAFADADGRATLSYDARPRGTAVERHPTAALHRIVELEDRLARLEQDDLDEPLQVSALVERTLPPVTGWSTRSRELAFVVSHTVHHQAIIRILLATLGIQTPATFGYAPSTPVRLSA